MHAVCSFCGDRPVLAWFEGPDFHFVVDSADKVRSQEAWLACGACLALVESDDRQAVTARAVARARRKERDTGRDIGLTDEALMRLERSRLDESFWVPRLARH